MVTSARPSATTTSVALPPAATAATLAPLLMGVFGELYWLMGEELLREVVGHLIRFTSLSLWGSKYARLRNEPCRTAMVNVRPTWLLMVASSTTTPSSM